MDRFIVHHRDRILGTLACFDRVIFKGPLPISHPTGLEPFFTSWLGLKLKEFKEVALHLAGRLKEHAQAVAQQAGRPYQYLNRPVRKEDLARQIAERDGVQRGLICVFGSVEPVQAFRLAYGEGRPRLASDWRKCLVHYFYLLDPEFGFMHVRRPTWFPFTMQVYVNGHEGLVQRLKQMRLTFSQPPNAFPTFTRPQLADQLPRQFKAPPGSRLLCPSAS